MIFSRSARREAAGARQLGETLADALRSESRGTKNVMVEAAQTTSDQKQQPLTTSLRVNPRSVHSSPTGRRRALGRAPDLVRWRRLLRPDGFRFVMTSMPVCAQNAPLVPVRQLVSARPVGPVGLL